MSSEDHPDWWRPIGGQNSQDSILERRSLIWNDDDIEDGTVPDDFYEAAIYKGKFFTRGCRGMLEQLQLYCIGDAVDTITLRYSPHPCLGPVGEVTIVPAAAWAWQAFVIEEMWDYDSLFIWVYEAEANVDWAYDAVLPYDGHLSADVGATWSAMAIRPFIRAVYTGETPGDVPVSGIINNIEIPASSSEQDEGTMADVQAITTLVDIHGIGYCDLILFGVIASQQSHNTQIVVECDDEIAFQLGFDDMNRWSIAGDTPTVSMTAYIANGGCYLILTKMFEFRRRMRVRALNPAQPVTVSWFVHPTLLR